MGKVFNVSFLTLFAILSQEMVTASHDSWESSSLLYIRHKETDSPNKDRPGTSPSHQLPPFLAYDLHQLKINEPTPVSITKKGATFSTGYAIHSYLILVKSVYVHAAKPYGVSIYDASTETYIPQTIKSEHTDGTRQFSLLELQNPIFLDNPHKNALTSSKYSPYAIGWAEDMAKDLIPQQLSCLRKLLEQNLNELRFGNPTLVRIASSDMPFYGNGYAVHPYIVITRPRFVGTDCHVVTITKREQQFHRPQFSYRHKKYDIEVIELLDPVLLTTGITEALAADQYSKEATAWAKAKANEWKRTRLGQRNFYRRNKEE